MSKEKEGQQLRLIVAEAEEHIEKRELVIAGQKLKQASAIAPDNANVNAALERLREEESRSDVVGRSKAWSDHGREEDGRVLLAILHGRDFAPAEALQAYRQLSSSARQSETTDRAIGALLQIASVRSEVVERLSARRQDTLAAAFEQGEQTVNGTVRITLEHTLWGSSEARRQSEAALFRMALQRLGGPGAAAQGGPAAAAALALALLLASSDGAALAADVGPGQFSALCRAVDARAPEAVRSRATIAMAKLFELAPDASQAHLVEYMNGVVAGFDTDALASALSAAATIFAVAPAQGSSLFLATEFLEKVLPLVIQEADQDQDLRLAVLRLLDAACVDKACREAVAKHFSAWLAALANGQPSSRASRLAAITFLKTASRTNPETDKKAARTDTPEDAIIARFQETVRLSTDDGAVIDAIEGLTYTSLDPTMKERLAGDTDFLVHLIKHAGHQKSNNVLFGALNILLNLTAYPPPQSEEQKQVSKLKAYANASKPAPPSALEDGSHVASRGRRVLEAGVVPLLLSVSKQLSPGGQLLLIKILLSLGREPKNRGKMAQQGAPRLLLQIWDRLETHKPDRQGPDRQGELRSVSDSAAHALALILVSVNPAHMFVSSSGISTISALRPLISLISESESDGPISLLPAFEALLALTNLASADEETRAKIVELAWVQIEQLLLNEHEMVQRATTELLCNLMLSDTCTAKFTDGSPRADHRLHLLFALADLDDTATRLAAGGALAMLTEHEAAVKAIIARDKGVEILLELCRDEDEGARQRGVFCINNIINIGGPVGQQSRAAVIAEGGVPAIKDMVCKSQNEEVLVLGAETLKILLSHE